ncbi:MAG TPA: RNA methyltransferase [Burkholderiales bacterium]|nr:RNA methyltransferase [Burkholderiales bacterium]
MTGSPRRITSASNPHFRALVKLQQSSRERRKSGLSLLDGVHLLAAYLDHAGSPEEIVVSDSGAAVEEIAKTVRRAGVMPLVVSDGLFRELSSVTTPTGVIAIVRTPKPDALPQVPGPCVMLEDIQDPGNLGSILRSAAAAGVYEIYLSRHSVHAWSPRVIRAGMGAHFMLRIYEQVDLETVIERCRGPVLAATMDAQTPLYSADLTGDVALLFGNEGAGLSAEVRRRAHRAIQIPMRGPAESLNVAAAAAICLFERVRQLGPPFGGPPRPVHDSEEPPFLAPPTRC